MMAIDAKSMQRAVNALLPFGSFLIVLWILLGLFIADAEKNVSYQCLFLGTTMVASFFTLKVLMPPAGGATSTNIRTDPEKVEPSFRRGCGCFSICAAFQFAVMLLLSALATIFCIAEAAASAPEDAFDPALSALVLVVTMLVLAFALVGVKGAVAAPGGGPRPGCGCVQCGGYTCAFSVLPLALLFLGLCTWHYQQKAATASLPPLGLRVPVTLPGGAHPVHMHLYCTGGENNAALPTVLFLHGITGSALDAEHVRTNPSVVASGVRFCSVDRPGYGWSDTYDAALPADFASAAALTRAALMTHFAPTSAAPLRLVVMAHSLGGYHSGAFVAAVAFRPSGRHPAQSM